MIPVEKTIEDIKRLMAGGDLSDTPQLRQLHRAACQAFAELNADLEKCRALMENGDIRAARELDRSFDPPLTRVAEQLEYFDSCDFFAVCGEYGLDAPKFPDRQLLTQLNTPFSSGEKHLHALLQDYRKIARNAGMRERIDILRKIVKKLPRSARWRGDLIAAERSRCQEIERELEQLEGKTDCCGKLEALYREVADPDWIVPPREELAAAIRRQLLPLQQAKFDREVEARLQRLQECWIERDIDRLGRELEQWRIFSTSPVIRLTAEQKQTIADIEAFFRLNAEEEKKRRDGLELIRRIERRLADNAPFADVAGDYNRLQVMDHPIPPALADRLRALEEESRRCDHLRNIRRCIYGVCGAALLAAAVVLAVSYTQHYLAVKRNSTSMQTFLDCGRYKEALAVYEKLKVSDPKIAASPKIIRLHAIAAEKMAEAERRRRELEEEFKRLTDQMEALARKDVLDNADALTEVIGRAEKINAESPQTKELLDRFSELKTRITRRRTELKQRRERDFDAICDGAVAEVDALIGQIPRLDPKDLDLQLEMLKKEFRNGMERNPYVPDHLKKRKQEAFDAALKRYDAARKRETVSRELNAPSGFDMYVAGLGKAYEYPDLADDYRRALELKNKWKREYDNYRGKLPEKLEDVEWLDDYGDGLLKSDLIRVIPKRTRSREFAKFVGGIAKQKDLREIVLTDAEGRPFFFYTRDAVRFEKLKNPRRINISFRALPVGQEKNSFFTIQYVGKGAKTPFVLKTKPRELPYRIPAAFALLDGRDEISRDDFCHPWPGRLLADKFKLEDGPGLNHNLQEALKFICGEGNIRNVYLKEMLLISFLRELHENAPLIYVEAGEALRELQELRKSHSGKYYAPQAVEGYDKDRAALEAQWAKLDIDRILNAGKLRADFVCGAHARRLIPVGVVGAAGEKELAIHLFDASAPPVEEFVLVFEREGKKLLPLPAEARRGRMPRDDRWRERLFRGQLVWGFEDGRKTEDFLRDWKRKARELNVELRILPDVIPDGKE